MAKDDDEVGYKKPPKNTQFKPGQSGNPAGRPKVKPNLFEDIFSELEREVVIKENGRRRTVTKQELVAASLVNNAAKGNLSAIKDLLKLAQQHLQIAGDGEAMPDIHLTPYDEEELQKHRELIREMLIDLHNQGYNVKNTNPDTYM